MGPGEWREETGHPWEQCCSWGNEALGKTQAFPQVVKHFIVGCVLGQGVGVTSGEDAPPKCDRLKLHEARFPRGEETHFSVCKLFQ